MTKNMIGRVAQKIDSSENWDKAKGFIPVDGEFFLVRDADCPIVIGDGKTSAPNLRHKTLFEKVSTDIIEEYIIEGNHDVFDKDFFKTHSDNLLIDVSGLDLCYQKLQEKIKNSALPINVGEGENSLRMNECVAQGDFSFSGGFQSKVYGYAGFGFGDQVSVYGRCASGFGYGVQVNGLASHGEGYQTIIGTIDDKGQSIEVKYAHAEGYRGQAKGEGSHVEGRAIYVNGTWWDNIAEGLGAHSEGRGTQALGAGSHSQGNRTIARGANSHAGGLYTIASVDNQTVIGKYNRENSNALFIVGNGTSSTNYGRKNAFEVLENNAIKIGSTILSEQQLTKILKFIDTIE